MATVEMGRKRAERPSKGSDHDISAFLARLWAQADKLMADLENAALPPKEQASVLATLARIAPQLVAAERQYQMAIDGRDLATLTTAQLKALIKDIDSR